MRTLFLKHDYKRWASQQKGMHADPSHVKDMIDENTIIVAPDMSITAVLLKECIEPKRYERACRMWSRVNQVPSNRITACRRFQSAFRSARSTNWSWLARWPVATIAATVTSRPARICS